MSFMSMIAFISEFHARKIAPFGCGAVTAVTQRLIFMAEKLHAYAPAGYCNTCAQFARAARREGIRSPPSKRLRYG